MKKFFLATLTLLAACTTYDFPQVYHKNFQPGKNEKLRFSGYYTEVLTPNDLQSSPVKPVFFYSDGSAFSAGKSYNSTTPVNAMEGAWGNYRIIADTILLERFDLIANNYRRIILRGVLSSDTIHWTSRKDHNEDYKPIDYRVVFRPATAKPDSTLNWTRKRKKYNR